MRVRVLIRPKPGILDPQGQAVQRALGALGFQGVREVRVGRMVELELEDSEQVIEMCDRLLVNPLIEDYEVEEGYPIFDEEGNPIFDGESAALGGGQGGGSDEEDEPGR